MQKIHEIFHQKKNCKRMQFNKTLHCLPQVNAFEYFQMMWAKVGIFFSILKSTVNTGYESSRSNQLIHLSPKKFCNYMYFEQIFVIN